MKKEIDKSPLQLKHILYDRLWREKGFGVLNTFQYNRSKLNNSATYLHMFLSWQIGMVPIRTSEVELAEFWCRPVARASIPVLPLWSITAPYLWHRDNKVTVHLTAIFETKRFFLAFIYYIILWLRSPFPAVPGFACDPSSCEMTD